MGARVAAVGFCCIDVYEDPPRSYPTGNGIDWVIHLARRGVGASALCAVGEDGWGRELLELLAANGVDTSRMKVEPGDTSRFHMELKNGIDRVHLRNVPGVMEHFALDEADIAFLQGFDYVHTDLTGRCLHQLAQLRERGAKIVFDFSLHATPETMAELLPHIDYAFFSLGEERKAEGRAFLTRAAELGGGVVTATFGEQGSLCWDGERFHEHGIVEVPRVVNTVGAGDGYISGFTWGLIRGEPIPACMAHGAALAAEVIQKFEPY